MKNLNLANNYYFEIIADEKKNKEIAPNINKISFKDIKKKKQLMILIDFKTIQEKDYKRILKHLLLIKKLAKLCRIRIGNNKNCVGYLVNYDKEDKAQKDFIAGVDAILHKTRRERYNYIYDKVCEDLDNCFYGKNVCDFHDNQCGEKRGTTSYVGCCRRYKYKFFGKFRTCKHLNKDYKCGAKCLACKLFTCDYLENKGIIFRVNDFLLLKTFFNPLQKIAIKCLLYTPKKTVLNVLMIL